MSPFASFDVKRARVRGDLFVWIGVALCAGSLASAHLVPTLVACAIACGVLFERRRRVIAVLLSFAIAIGMLRARGAIDRYEDRRRAIVQESWPSRCIVSGTIARSPVSVGGGLRVDLDAVPDDVQCRDGPLSSSSPTSPKEALRPVRISLHVPLDLAIPVGRGDSVRVVASVAPPYRFWNDGTGDPRPTSARRTTLLSGGADDLVVVRKGWGVRWAIDFVRDRVRRRIIATFPNETAPMARALVLGEDDLTQEDQRAFRRSGLAHLLAVSGMHLVLVVMSIVAALRALFVRIPALASRFDVMRLASAIGVPIAWIYADLAGGSGSAIRAAWMCSVALLARALGRRPQPWRALGVSIVAMWIADPLVAFDLSFVLSALATVGILALSGPIEERAKRAWPHRLLLSSSRAETNEESLGQPRSLALRMLELIIKPIATTLAATIACSPVLALMAPELPLVGLLANIVAVPLGELLALPLCLAHALLFVWPAAESGCALVASGALDLVRVVARGFAWGAVPVPTPTAGQIAAIASGAVAITLGIRQRIAIGGALVTIIALEIVVRVHGAPHGKLRATFLDVGQGDSTLIDLPDGSSMLIDGGGLVGSPLDVGERAVAPLLGARRRRSIDIVVLSHPHPDHFLGLPAAFAQAKPREFWDTGQGELDEMRRMAESANPSSYAMLLADLRARGVPIERPSDLCGTHAIGGAIVEVLAPCPSIDPDHGANDNSFVVRVRFGSRAILLVGDAEGEEERALLDRKVLIRADVLKVGHHGSRTSSSPELLDAVHPELAVISCGVRNRFGHPHAETLEELARAGTKRVLRTDRTGSVVVTTDGRSLDVRTMIDE